jgi:hypothetical protein
VAVAGDEGDPAAGDGADGGRRRRRTVGRLDLYRLRVGEELVEPRAAEDPDLGRRGIAHELELDVVLVVLLALSDEPDPDDPEPAELDEVDESPDELPAELDDDKLESEPDEELPEDDADEPFFDPRLSVL